MKFTLSFIITIILGLPVQAQDTTANAIDSTMLRLKKAGEVVLSRQPDSSRLPAHQDFKSLLDSALTGNPDSLIALDSIRNLSVLTTSDSSLRLITWLFPFDNGAYKFFGYIQYFNPVDSIWQLKKLKDNHKKIENPEKSVLTAENWYGALYYDLIINENYITLLGWNGYHDQLNQKVIDILHFDSTGSPAFGKKVFAEYGDSVRRVILEYAEDASVTLEHELILHQVRIPSENAFMTSMRTKKIKEKMIYFNRLDPIQPMFEGDRRYYVPLSEKMQGFYFEKGKWVFRDKLTILSKNPPEEQEGILDLNLIGD